jgi:hypothetical protein
MRCSNGYRVTGKARRAIRAGCDLHGKLIQHRSTGMRPACLHAAGTICPAERHRSALSRQYVNAVSWLQGKVRDTYDLGDKVVIVTTDRQSAFDRLLASVPFKGQVCAKLPEGQHPHALTIACVPGPPTLCSSLVGTRLGAGARYPCVLTCPRQRLFGCCAGPCRC